MKRLTILTAALLTIPVMISAAPEPKVVICHATSSLTNPWVEIEISSNAIGGHFDNPGTPKAGHEDDLLLPEGSHCPAPTVVTPPPPTPTPTPTPTPPITITNSAETPPSSNTPVIEYSGAGK